MLINGVDMTINLSRAPDAFYLLGPSVDKIRIKILDATLFITQVELKPPLLAGANVLGMKHKTHPVTVLKTFTASSDAQQVSIMHSLDQFQNGL